MKLRLLLLVLAWLPFSAFAAEIQMARQLHEDASLAKDRGQTIIVLFSASYCHFCDRVKNEVFKFLENDRRYQGNIVLREVIIDASVATTDFSGSKVSHSALGSRFGVSLVPTVSFFDGHGKELTDRMVGVASMDLYGWYLDARIKRALKSIRSELASRRQPADGNAS